MTRLSRAERMSLLVAGAILLIAPAVVLWPGDDPVPHAQRPAPLRPPAALPPLSAVYARPLFAEASFEAEPLPADVPALVGVAGRLGADAVALVRGASGATRALSPGDGIDGWTLESVAIDAAYFTRGGQRARVPMPEDGE